MPYYPPSTSLPAVDETAIVYKTGNVAITQTYNIDAYTVARVVSWPDAAGTVALLNVANVFTANQTISSATLSVPHSGSNSERIGALSSATGANSTAVGNSAAATNTSTTAIGYNASAAGSFATAIGTAATTGANNNAVAIGAQASVTGAGGIAIGQGVSAAANATVIGPGTTASTSSTAIGSAATASGSTTVAIGPNSLSSGNNGTSCGAGASATAFQATALGSNAAASQTAATALGNSAAAAFASSVALGRGAATTKANQLVVGAVANAVNEVYPYCLTSSTTAIQNLYIASHKSSGTPAAGFGVALLAQLESSTTEDQSAGRLSWEWATATHASRAARGKLTAYDTAERECVRFEASGTAPMLGVLGAAAIARQAHIADPSGGGTQDAEARTAINAILAALENFGFLATS